jgi:L-threonylcarbamoyladenylate synthase
VLTQQQLSEACGVKVITPTAPDADAPRASGTLESHYAPTATVQLMTTLKLQSAIEAYVANANRTASEGVAGPATVAGTVAIWSRSPVQLPATRDALFQWQAMPLSARDCAHLLFAQLRDFDAQGAAHIWVEAPPPSPEWDGVRDRLTRAAAPTR